MSCLRDSDFATVQIYLKGFDEIFLSSFLVCGSSFSMLRFMKTVNNYKNGIFFTIATNSHDLLDGYFSVSLCTLLIDMYINMLVIVSFFVYNS